MDESVKLQPVLKKRTLSPKQRKLPNFSLGAYGESLARRYLQQHHYRILSTNAQYKTLEIDIVALDKQTYEVVFVEVKARSSSSFGNPSRAVGWKKQQKLQQLASMYCERQRLENDYRFDIIAVSPGKLEHFKNITWP